VTVIFLPSGGQRGLTPKATFGSHENGEQRRAAPRSMPSVTRLLDGLRFLVLVVHVAEAPRPGGARADEEVFIVGVGERRVRHHVPDILIEFKIRFDDFAFHGVR
jgi:hypothetical protein